MINVVKDIDLMDNICNHDVILIATNVYCTMSQGIQREIALNYPYVREDNLNLGKYGDVSKLGTLLECKRDNEPLIVLLYSYRGYPYRKQMDEDYLDYHSLEKCLIKVNKKYANLNIGTTFLGCSRFDGNGDKNKVMEIMEKTLTDVNVTVYDYYQKSRSEKLKEIRTNELKLKEVSYDLYHEAVKHRKEEAEKRYKRNGFARY